MHLFRYDHRSKSARHKRISAAFELAYTIVDFTAAFCFLVGSVLFFWQEWETQAIWLFVIGSLFFAAKPTLRLARELKLAAIGDVEDLADRFEN